MPDLLARGRNANDKAHPSDRDAAPALSHAHSPPRRRRTRPAGLPSSGHRFQAAGARTYTPDCAPSSGHRLPPTAARDS